MITPEMRTAIRTLKAQGASLRQIAQDLKISRNAVRRALRAPDGAPVVRRLPVDRIPPDLGATLERACGNAMRVRELLAADGTHVSYSTLTRWLREAGLRAPPARAGEYVFAPGCEMQHDTSPHRVTIGGRVVTAQCAGLVLAYSRRLFMAYAPRFTRFEAKHFLREAAVFMDGTCPRCVIDNTHVVLASGSGSEAIIAPEMAAFARTLGFGFVAHRIGHPDRKGRIERVFAYIEGHFLPGRTFRDYADLNAQARLWCETVANATPKRVLGMSAEAAYVLEKPYLTPLPAVLPPVYEVVERTVDLSGFISLDANRYSVPERLCGRPVTVYKYPERVAVHDRGTLVAEHARLIDRRQGTVRDPAHHPTPVRKARTAAPEDTFLWGDTPLVHEYAQALRRHTGQGRRRLRRLQELQRTYPAAPFQAAIRQALAFGLFDMARLEALILKQVAGNFFALEAPGEPPDAF